MNYMYVTRSPVEIQTAAHWNLIASMIAHIPELSPCSILTPLPFNCICIFSRKYSTACRKCYLFFFFFLLFLKFEIFLTLVFVSCRMSAEYFKETCCYLIQDFSRLLRKYSKVFPPPFPPPRNVGIYLQICAASHSRRKQTSWL